MKWTFDDAWQLAIAIGVPLVGGFVGAMSTQSEVNTWYKTLKKPWWTPPNWLFGPMWSALYIMMGTAAWLVYRQGGFEKQLVPLSLYCSQLLFNFAWTYLFFRRHWVDIALIDIIVLLAGEILTASEFSKVIGVPLTLGLLGPLVAWTTLATALTLDIYQNNPQVQPGFKNRIADKIE